MVGTFKIIPITSEDTSFSKDGKTINSFKITVMQGEEVLTMPCTNLAYADAKKYQFKACNAVIEISTGLKDGKEYKTYKLLELAIN